MLVSFSVYMAGLDPQDVLLKVSGPLRVLHRLSRPIASSMPWQLRMRRASCQPTGARPRCGFGETAPGLLGSVWRHQGTLLELVGHQAVQPPTPAPGLPAVRRERALGADCGEPDPVGHGLRLQHLAPGRHRADVQVGGWGAGRFRFAMWRMNQGAWTRERG